MLGRVILPAWAWAWASRFCEFEGQEDLLCGLLSVWGLGSTVAASLWCFLKLHDPQKGEKNKTPSNTLYTASFSTPFLFVFVPILVPPGCFLISDLFSKNIATVTASSVWLGKTVNPAGHLVQTQHLRLAPTQIHRPSLLYHISARVGVWQHFIQSESSIKSTYQIRIPLNPLSH